MLLIFETCFKLKKNVILGVLKNETCYKMGRISTRDFTVVGIGLSKGGISFGVSLFLVFRLFFKVYCQLSVKTPYVEALNHRASNGPED